MKTFHFCFDDILNVINVTGVYSAKWQFSDNLMSFFWPFLVLRKVHLNHSHINTVPQWRWHFTNYLGQYVASTSPYSFDILRRGSLDMSSLKWIFRHCGGLTSPQLSIINPSIMILNISSQLDVCSGMLTSIHNTENSTIYNWAELVKSGQLCT